MHTQSTQARFEQAVLVHLDAAYNLARWILHDTHDAEDAVQDASIRAYRAFDSLRGDGRPWFLRIVRNTCCDHAGRPRHLSLDDLAVDLPADTGDPAAAALRGADSALIGESLAALPVDAREILILRDVEDLSYREIGQILEIPIGTVMSRLSRARRRLRECLGPKLGDMP